MNNQQEAERLSKILNKYYGFIGIESKAATPHRGKAQEMQDGNGFSDAEARGKESEDSAASGED